MAEGRLPVTRYGLLRHAKSEWNRLKRIQGQKDSPLSEEGKREAQEWGKFLDSFRWDRIMTSDTGRALETANIINSYLNVPLHTDTGLREQDWGTWSGKTLADIKRQEPDFLEKQINLGWRFCPPGGEDRLALLKRSRDSLISAANRWPRENILVITHEGVVKCLVYHLLGRRFLPSEPRILKTSRLHWVVCHDGVIELQEINVARR
ncbi:MAG: histidine phosphatase family protein [Deltaproteobacteria bacterium]|nr:histidine phosphatase family protein [Deltaproteobacteria bacterium]